MKNRTMAPLSFAVCVALFLLLALALSLRVHGQAQMLLTPTPTGTLKPTAKPKPTPTPTPTPTPLPGRTLFVDADATGANNGTSWEDAFSTLQAALDAAGAGDAIWVGAGTYTPTHESSPGDPRSATFQLKNGMAVYGGFDPTVGDVGWEDRDWVNNVTILSGDIGTVGDSSDNSYHVFYHPPVLALDRTAALDGFTVSGGNADGGGWPNDCGGGMYNDHSSPAVANCTFSDNSALVLGGGMYNDTGYKLLPMTNCTFLDNSAVEGGGMFNASSALVVMTNCTFSGNLADLGGGMYNNANQITLTNCTFLGNSATNDGGAMYNYLTVRVTNSILWGDSPSEISGGGNVTYSDVQGGREGTGNIDAAPLFADPGSGDYHLGPGSPCIDAGSNGAPALPDADFEGDPRVVNGDGDGTAVVDMGIDEAPEIAQSIFYVDQDAEGNNDGSSWEDAFIDLQDALDAADGDQIWVAEGTYTPTHLSSPGEPRSATFQLKKGVVVYGGFDPAVGDVGWEDRDWVNNVTILSGDIGTVGDPADNCYHVFYHPSELALDGSTILDGFTVSGGNANGPSDHVFGGGMLNAGASPAIANCTFSGNSADYFGGGMSNLYSSPAVTSCTFSGNSASDGGGMYNGLSSSPVVSDCTFLDNSAYRGGGMADRDGSSPAVTDCTFEGNTADYGGGMYNYDSWPAVTGCAFTGNSASHDGGGMLNHESSPVVTECTFSSNSAVNDGGGMRNVSSSPQVTDSTFTGNSAAGGGGMSNESSSPVVTHGTFEDNSASSEGGGMRNASSSPMVRNSSLFSGNTAHDGGGMYNHASSPVVTDGIFEDNSASNDGGGMLNNESSPVVANCIFSGNSAGVHGGGILNDGSSPSVTDCTFSGNSANYSGGGMYNSGSSPVLTQCIFTGNSSDHGGSGMANWVSSSPTVIDCTFSGNSGEGMANWQYSSPTVTDCTFTGNLGDGMHNNDWSSPAVVNSTFIGNSGSGMSNVILSSPAVINCTFSGNSAHGMSNWSSSPTVTNCILWGDSLGEISNDESEPVVTHSDIQGGHDGTGNIDADPLFVDPDTGNYHLGPGSPCIDAGTNDAPSLPVHDFEGDIRVMDGNGDAMPVVDMGADEVWATPPDVIHVDQDAAGYNTGTSWEDALIDLQDALAWAVDGVEIWVAEGTYYPSAERGGSGDRYRTFQLKNGVALYGGFDPTAGDAGWENRDWGSNVTVLSGDIGTPGDPADNSYHVFYHPSELTLDGTALLDGFTISGGNANGDDWPNYAGAGMLNDSSSPAVLNCTFASNSATFGGGMFNDGSSPAVASCTFAGNSALFAGGMYNSDSSPVLTDCTFMGNSADYRAGGMYNSDSSPVLTNCTFTGNSAADSAGAMANMLSSAPILENCTFSGNSADVGGAMIIWSSASPTLTNCTFTGNSATSGGGMLNFGSPAITNSILWGDSPDEIANGSGGEPVVTYSDILGGYDGDGNIDADPLFVDPASGDYHLGPSSPCIDAGTNDAPNLPAYDFEGDPRVVDGNGDGIAVVDMGVDEVFGGHAVYLPLIFRSY